VRVRRGAAIRSPNCPFMNRLSRWLVPVGLHVPHEVRVPIKCSPSTPGGKRATANTPPVHDTVSEVAALGWIGHIEPNVLARGRLSPRAVGRDRRPGRPGYGPGDHPYCDGDLTGVCLLLRAHVPDRRSAPSRPSRVTACHVLPRSASADHCRRNAPAPARTDPAGRWSC